MNKVIYLLLICVFFFSCQEVIDVQLKTTSPRLVIDASLMWVKGTQGNEQEIKLSLTAPYFNTNIPPANGATVIITDTNNNTFNFVEDANTGLYKNSSFIPNINGIYNLFIIYNNETYSGTETLYSVPAIDHIEQNDNGGFSGEDIEIKAYYTDPENEENYYLFQFENNNNVPMLEVYDDEFNDGNQIFGFFSDEEMKSGDNLRIKISGISERHYEYLNILLQQTDEESGDPFETQPATVRGNCVNQTNPENYPLGYFRITETDVFNYSVQ
ncbi:DUF4249 domain-containing protein [Seonamhaeicola sp. MEBiC1930]|uniref:DUF4249 domain-containing protein n=1 Tax=Seonamhaeicola sp. MEBiC01930 TaxID=2976768 RepID=UPI0032457027